MALAIDVLLDEVGIPNPWSLNEDGVVGVMRMAEVKIMQ